MPNHTTTSSFSVMIQPAKNTSTTRMTIASVRPRLRALACCSFGSLLARIEMKMTLSTPSTISRTNSVTKTAIEVGREGEGEVHSSIVGGAPPHSDPAPSPPA